MVSWVVTPRSGKVSDEPPKILHKSKPPFEIISEVAPIYIFKGSRYFGPPRERLIEQ